MSYSSLSNSDFAEELIKNHLKASRYSKVAKDLDSFGVPFRQSFAEALMEVSYGSGSIFGYLRSDIYYIDFLNNARNAKQIKILQPHTYVIGIIIIKLYNAWSMVYL